MSKGTSYSKPSSRDCPKGAGVCRLDYSQRRYYVDLFHFRHVPRLRRGSRVLDLGGHKKAKRGCFDLGQYDLDVVYANLSAAKSPDVQADAISIPFHDTTFDAVICSEVLEHVLHPRRVLKEIHRVLNHGGRVLLCVPFIGRVHGDPFDYGRYTDWFWREALTNIGYRHLHIEKQGTFWSVLVDMLRDLIGYSIRNSLLPGHWMGRILDRSLYFVRVKALTWESKPEAQHHPLFGSYTTGFGIIAEK